ncbi:MAG TPA: homoserine O-acetyltransferase [Planctomycetaceae bacterium]|nr:homoserine O-acetyltransferase [Planctomycetaceae bacterium]
MSTDQAISAPPDPDPRSVGIVQTQTIQLFQSPHPLVLASGERFGPITVAYETYGKLSPERDNAIFVCHALTGDAHVAGRRSPEEPKPGWWDELVGPGKGLDTNKYFVICANAFGGCQGTTGPSSINPETGTQYGPKFPFITVGDIVNVHAELVRALGIEKLLAIIGGSLGGMQVLQWTANYPDQVAAAIVLASGARLSAQGIAFNMVGRRAITTDPHFHNGNYYHEEHGPRFGLALARMVAHITYLSEASIEQKFGRRLQHSDTFAYDLLREVEFQIESYLHYQGKRFVERFDANSYLHLTRAMDYFDLAEGHSSLAKALSKTRARFLVASYSSDWLFPVSQSREIVAALVESRQHVTAVELTSPAGHDSFLLEVEPLEELLHPFLDETYAATRKALGRSVPSAHLHPTDPVPGTSAHAPSDGAASAPANLRRARRYCMPDPFAKLTDEIIMGLIPPGSRVLDLGCGDGRLLAGLRDKYGSAVQGIELDLHEIRGALARGVPVIQSDLDRGLEEFPDHAFDFAVLSQTLQQVRHPKLILREMLRVARQALVVAPNFGHWKVRLQVTRYGRAPVTSALPYEWYNTPNLHFMSMKDFRELADHVDARIVTELPIVRGRAVKRAWAANLRADSALYVLEHKS